jgi:hypothetical protein
VTGQKCKAVCAISASTVTLQLLGHGWAVSQASKLSGGGRGGWTLAKAKMSTAGVLALRNRRASRKEASASCGCLCVIVSSSK